MIFKIIDCRMNISRLILAMHGPEYILVIVGLHH